MVDDPACCNENDEPSAEQSEDDGKILFCDNNCKMKLLPFNLSNLIWLTQYRLLQ